MSVSTRIAALVLSGIMAALPGVASAQPPERPQWFVPGPQNAQSTRPGSQGDPNYEVRSQNPNYVPRSGNQGYRPQSNHRGNYSSNRGYSNDRAYRNGGGHGHGYYRDRGGDDDAAVAAGIIGLAVGAMAAGAAARNTDDDHVEWCLRRYRSYDPRTDTYLGRDGRRHYCR